MNIFSGFAKLVYAEKKSDSMLFLLSFSKPVKKGTTEQNNNPRQFWARMPMEIYEYHKSLELKPMDHVEVSGHVNSLVFRDDRDGTESVYPEVVIRRIARATVVGDLHPQECRFINKYIVSAYIKYIQPFGDGVADNPDKPIYIVAQINPQRERPKGSDRPRFRRSDTLQFALFRNAKLNVIKAMDNNQAIGYGFILMGNVTGHIVHSKVDKVVGKDARGNDIIVKKYRERYHPAISFLAAEPTFLLCESMFSPINSANGHDESRELESGDA